MAMVEDIEINFSLVYNVYGVISDNHIVGPP